MRFCEGVVPYGTALFSFVARKFGLRIMHHSLGKTRFDKLRGFGGWPPFLQAEKTYRVLFIEKSVCFIVNPLGKAYHGINIFLEGQRITSVIIDTDVLLVSHTVIMWHVKI